MDAPYHALDESTTYPAEFCDFEMFQLEHRAIVPARTWDMSLSEAVDCIGKNHAPVLILRF
jgi:hypothetical protein